MTNEEQLAAIDTLRCAGLAVIVMSQEEVRESGLSRRDLESALLDVVTDAHWRICRQDDFGMDGEDLSDKYGSGADHPQYTREDYELVVGCAPSENSSYWDWVASELR